MFFASTVYGISAIIVGAFMAIFYDEAYDNSVKRGALDKLIKPAAVHVILLAFIIVLMMTPFVNTLFAMKSLKKVKRRVVAKSKK